MIIGLLAVTNTSDTFPAVLVGIPGTSSAQATILDGFPLARRGEAARALGAAFSASLLGGLFGALLLTLAIQFARPLILGVGFGEQLMLVVLALTMVGMLTGASALKGLAMCGVGLLFGSMGAAPATAEYRLTFDTVYLSDGIPLVIVGLAMFAVPEMVDVLRKREHDLVPARARVRHVAGISRDAQAQVARRALLFARRDHRRAAGPRRFGHQLGRLRTRSADGERPRDVRQRRHPRCHRPGVSQQRGQRRRADSHAHVRHSRARPAWRCSSAASS